jgi:hypothetical protein
MVLAAWPVFVPFVFLYLVIKMHKASVKKKSGELRLDLHGHGT